MPFSNKTFVRVTLLLMATGFAAVFAIIAFAVVLAGRNDATGDALIDVLSIRRESLAVLNGMVNAETGQRGYLLTLEEPYLQPYKRAAAALGERLTNLRRLAADHPEYLDGIDTLGARIKGKLAELDATIELARAGRVQEAIAIVRTDRGRQQMDAVREAADGLLKSTDALISRDTARLRSSATQLLWVLIVGGLIILGVVGGTGYVAWRYTRDLEVAQAELSALNATLEARVRDRTADVARANEEIQRFAYIVSHDLRSPLVNIMGFTSELEAGLGEVRAFLDRSAAEEGGAEAEPARAAVDREMPEALDFIRSSTTKMDRLINAILKLSREGQRRLAPERVNMHELLSSAAASVRHQLGEAGTEFEIEGPIPDIVTDRLAVEQVFGNLIDNAVKYLDTERPGKVLVRARETAMGIEYDVEDNGRGIEEKDHERVFDLFRRAGPQDRPGEGIGLSSVRALVRRLGGSIYLRSKPDMGTTFTVRLPRILSVAGEG